jgi:hypothetical protein
MKQTKVVEKHKTRTISHSIYSARCVWGKGEVCTGCWWGSLRERHHWGDPDVDERIILTGIFRKWEGRGGTGWGGLRIGTGGGHL